LSGGFCLTKSAIEDAFTGLAAIVAFVWQAEQRPLYGPYLLGWFLHFFLAGFLMRLMTGLLILSGFLAGLLAGLLSGFFVGLLAGRVSVSTTLLTWVSVCSSTSVSPAKMTPVFQRTTTVMPATTNKMVRMMETQQQQPHPFLRGGIPP